MRVAIVNDQRLATEALRRVVRLRVSTRALRTVQRYGGLDRFLMTTADAKLAEPGLRLKRAVRKASAQLLPDPPQPAVQGLGPLARLLPQIPDLSNRTAGTRPQGLPARRAQVELVGKESP